MNSYTIQLLQEHKQELYIDWKESIQFMNDPHLDDFKWDEELNQEVFNLTFLSLEKGEKESYTDLRQYYGKLLEKDWCMNYLTAAFQQFRRSVLKLIIKEESSRDRIVELYEEVDEWFDPVITYVVNDCAEKWHYAYMKQRETVRELTAPMIPVFNKICVLPLIGNISDDRAEIIKGNLLEGIVQYRAEYVLLDITGVPVVDTYVANYLMQATEAASMLGSTCIIVGIRPEIAQTLVSLGIKLNVLTFFNLHKGIEYVLQQTNHVEK